MSELRYTKLQRIVLSGSEQFDERWVQDRIAEDPSLLGLGDLVLKDKERRQPKAGRLDLLFQEVETFRRYEVEIQLGQTDETHIIRTLEYWDLERKQYPQYEHTAVLVAEDVTSRFLNVVALFNGFIPLVALQMHAYQVGDTVSLAFTKILDQVRLGPVDEDESTVDVADRAYWETRSGKVSLEIVDTLLDMLKSLDSEITANYRKSYIGIGKRGRSNNVVHFSPRKEWLWLGVRLGRTPELDKLVDSAGFAPDDYDAKWGKYYLRLTKADVTRQESFLRDLLRRALDEEKL